MKTKIKKLVLSRESIRLLERSDLQTAAGQAPQPTHPRDETCLTCRSCFATCTC